MSIFRDLGKAGAYLGQVARLMVGLPDYERYVAHLRASHPGASIPSYEEFFRDRQDARFGAAARVACC